MTTLKSNNPIIIGLAGKAGSGKTSVAEQIVPKGSIEIIKENTKWDHIFYALPLYEMASIKKNTKGQKEESRKLFALHEVLYDVYGGSSLGNIPDYPNFVNLVNQINNLAIEPEGIKPRKFLQTAGDLCREHYPDCFSNWAISRAKKIYRETIRSSEDEDTKNVVVMVSDVRYLNEARGILEQPNGFIICFDATQETLNQRLLKRDGKLMSEDEMAHSSEKQIDYIKNIASAIIDTNNLNLEQQTEKTIEIINILKKESYA